MHELNNFVLQYEVPTHLFCFALIAVSLLGKANLIKLTFAVMRYLMAGYCVLVNVLEKGL